MANICSNEIIITLNEPLNKETLTMLNSKKTMQDLFNQMTKKHKTESVEWPFFDNEFNLNSSDEDTEIQIFIDSRWTPYIEPLKLLQKILKCQSISNSFFEGGENLAGKFYVDANDSYFCTIDYQYFDFLTHADTEVYLVDNLAEAEKLEEHVSCDALIFTKDNPEQLQKLEQMKVAEKLLGL